MSFLSGQTKLSVERGSTVNNTHEKILDSDWLRAVQFKCNTSAKSVTPVQITHRNERNIFRQFFCANFFMFVLLISNHTVFLVQFEINLHL